MKKALPTVTIGVAAYNEERNILNLIESILAQNCHEFQLYEIIIALDGCTDNTFDILKKIRDSRLRILNYENNLGKVARINNILSHAKSDYLVLYDADIILVNENSTANLLNPLLNSQISIDLSSGQQLPVIGNSWVEKIAGAGTEVWNNAKSLSGKNSVYYCSGGNRAMSRSFYRKLVFPNIMAEDIYPYLFAKENNLHFSYVDLPIIKYSLPKTFNDYIMRDKRYSLSPTQHRQLFGNDLINKEFTINRMIKLKALIMSIIKNPIWTLLYLAMFPVPKILAILDRNSSVSTWKPLASTRGGEQL